MGKNENLNNFDVGIIGGGPAGMMAAIEASKKGAKVLLIEKNSELGKKLLLTGGGRGNFTRAEFDPKKLAKNYGKKGDFLIHAFSEFGPKDTIEFFEKLGVKSKTENDKRIFPESNNAKSILLALVGVLEKNNVSLLTDCSVEKLEKSGNKISKLVLADGKDIVCKKYIICTGGMSFSQTGSTGDGINWAKSLGHSVETVKPALVPINIKDDWVKELQGLTIPSAGLHVLLNGRKKAGFLGDILFTHFGISGPIVLNASRQIGDLMEKGSVKIIIDLYPDMKHDELFREIQILFEENPGKTLLNCLREIMAPRMADVIVRQINIMPDQRISSIKKTDREALVKMLKNLQMEPESLMGFNEAIVTAGGILVDQINAKTMQSKIIDNLYFAGEIIGLHGPTGGYNLQLCWSTGFLAGKPSAE